MSWQHDHRRLIFPFVGITRQPIRLLLRTFLTSCLRLNQELNRVYAVEGLVLDPCHVAIAAVSGVLHIAILPFQITRGSQWADGMSANISLIPVILLLLNHRLSFDP